MQSLTENIHIEDKYQGVTLGAINLPRGLIYIDAPPTPESGQSWRADLLDLKCGPEQMLINLDENIDRIIGSRTLNCTVLAQKKVGEFFENRSKTFKAQIKNTGAIWEEIPNLNNIRWEPPQITFTDKITLHWGETPIILEHHPSCNTGAIWAIIPEEKIVFVGDTVLKNQPPFLAKADLPRWLKDLDLLTSEAYQGYTIVSGRGGVCASSTIEKQQNIIEIAYENLEKLASQNAEVEDTEKIIPKLLAPLRFLVSEKEIFTKRLLYGLKEYYLRNYNNPESEN